MPDDGWGNYLRKKWLCSLITITGIVCIGVYIYLQVMPEPEQSNDLLWVGLGLTSLGGALCSGLLPSISIGGESGGVLEFKERPSGDDEFRDATDFKPVNLKQKTLDEAEVAEKERSVDNVVLPNENAPRFTPFDPNIAKALKLNPSGFSKVPMYLLDSAFRVLDWNEAFSLVFDRTMEGRIGQSILHWTMHLRNFKEVTEEGSRVFGDPENVPRFHKETIEYDSLRYGEITGIKRAYAIPGDESNTIAWLITIEPRFESFKVREKYELEIVRLLENDLMWSEYALLYDRILTKTKVYDNLIKYMVGETGPLGRPADDARILDLGAGTGNLSTHLMELSRSYRVVAVENNRTMLEMLHDKCDQFSSDDHRSSGVHVIKQDITSLTGIDDDFFDYVILNNVLYAVDDYRACLQEVLRVLKPGGEVRISGPHEKSDANQLFTHIKEDLEEGGDYQRLEPVFKRVKWINEHLLLPRAHKFTADGLSEILRDIGFSNILCANYEIYRGQSLFVAASK